MKVFRHMLSFVIVAAFVISGAISHSHAMPPAMSGNAGHHMMQHIASGDHGHHHGDMEGQGSHADDTSYSHSTLHCCSMGLCGFLSPASPQLMQFVVTEIILEMTVCARASVETPPEAPPPRPVG